MNISSEKLQEFKVLYFNQVGIELSDQDALEYAGKLLIMTKIALLSKKNLGQ